MGTRADYYVGTGPNAEWLGSTTYDGYPDGIPEPIFKTKTEKAFRKAVAAIFADDNQHTLPEEGWPWPWDDSRTTDYAYAWVDGGVKLSRFGDLWETLASHDKRGEKKRRLRDDEVCNMKSRQADTATILAKSGLLIVGVPK